MKDWFKKNWTLVAIAIGQLALLFIEVRWFGIATGLASMAIGAAIVASIACDHIIEIEKDRLALATRFNKLFKRRGWFANMDAARRRIEWLENELVDRWHKDEQSERSLEDQLGMTQEEYGLWVQGTHPIGHGKKEEPINAQ